MADIMHLAFFPCWESAAIYVLRKMGMMNIIVGELDITSTLTFFCLQFHSILLLSILCESVFKRL